MTDKHKGGFTLAPIIFKEIGGTVYAVYGYFSPEATERPGQKIKRLLQKEIDGKKSGNH